MTFAELMRDIKSIPLDEIREEGEEYFECVLGRKHLASLYPFLELFFGPPFKPPGIKPTGAADDYTKNYGGILTQQTLYYTERDGLSHCGMIWPWNTGERATVKLALGFPKDNR